MQQYNKKLKWNRPNKWMSDNVIVDNDPVDHSGKENDEQNEKEVSEVKRDEEVPKAKGRRGWPKGVPRGSPVVSSPQKKKGRPPKVNFFSQQASF